MYDRDGCVTGEVRCSAPTTTTTKTTTTTEPTTTTKPTTTAGEIYLFFMNSLPTL